MIKRSAVHLMQRLPAPVYDRAARIAGQSAGVRRVSDWLARDVRGGTSVIPRGEAAGLSIDIAGSMTSYALGTTEPLVQATIAKTVKPGMAVIDCGANVGFFTLIAARAVGPTGKVVAFDPLPANTAAIRRNAELNSFAHLETVEAAVGERDGTMRFATGGRSVHGALATDGDLEVKVVELDAAIARGDVPVPDVIKLDIEGGEIGALAGLKDTLATKRPVLIIEVHETMAAVTGTLEAAGYRVSRLDPKEPEGNAHVVATWAG